MHRTIDFPNIGIHLESVGDHITVFGFDIAYYGMLIGLGILAGIFIAAAEAKRTKQKAEDYYDLTIYAVIFSIIGARLYYVIFSWDMYKDDLLSIFNIRQGGLAIYGGVIAAIITVCIFAKKRKMSAPLIMDTAGLGLVAGQMIGRWGNFFNREAFGEYTDGLFGNEASFRCSAFIRCDGTDAQAYGDGGWSILYSGTSDISIRILVVPDGIGCDARISEI